jgi:ribosomal protein S27AE
VGSSNLNRQPRTLENPKCPECGKLMVLAQIEPDKPDHDKRIFECPKCHHVLREIVKHR